MIELDHALGCHHRVSAPPDGRWLQAISTVGPDGNLLVPLRKVLCTRRAAARDRPDHVLQGPVTEFPATRGRYRPRRP